MKPNSMRPLNHFYFKVVIDFLCRLIRMLLEVCHQKHGQQMGSCANEIHSDNKALLSYLNSVVTWYLASEGYGFKSRPKRCYVLQVNLL